MKVKRFCVIAVLGLMIFSSSVFAANVEDALSPCPEDSVYMVLKLSDTSALLKWIFSKENIDTFMPLIIAQEESNEIIGGIELISMFAENTPLKTLALVGGVKSGDVPEPFFQMAFTVDGGETSVVKKIADGSATAVDVANLLLGDTPLTAMAESMIKVEKGSDNILRIDNELFIKAYDGVIIAGLSEDDVKASINALDHSDMRLFENKPRKFSTQDFAVMHIDIKTAKLLDDDITDEFDPEEFFDKPLHVEFGFDRVPDKFTILTALNLIESLKKEYTDNLTKKAALEPVKGGYMNLTGEKSPLLALSGYLDISGAKDKDQIKDFWKMAVTQLKNRFGITEEDAVNFFTGAFCVNVNDSITFEGFKIPALYISQTGRDGAAEKIYNTLTKSPHFQKVQDGVLQIDSSLSPIACLVQNKGDALGIHFAELANVTKTPELNPALKDLTEREAVSNIWLDFAGIQAWINESGVMLMLEPLSKFMGLGEVFDAAKEILAAKYSVPSMSISCESAETFRTEFNIVEVTPEEGLMRKLVTIARKYIKSE